MNSGEEASHNSRTRRGLHGKTAWAPKGGVSLKVAATRAGSSCASQCASSHALDELLSPAATECVSDDVVVTRAGTPCASTSSTWSSSFVVAISPLTLFPISG
ncbi:hypothetical protein B0H13DRAFT_2317711 [Mycena leptocephala]|nr:hypothetical protein B0H13DRAFT_2317711 [Mycena leptocephala]